MHIRTDFPHQVCTIPNMWIPLADGTRLAARIWLPTDAESHPVPAILEYIPYRKNDDTAQRDAIRHPYIAGHGYACVRVDLRGSGESDGILYDEYLPQEQDDALEVLAWLEAQDWCTGDVGIIGKSWGGFNGLQIAARRPPQLKAVISVCSTDDRYADDVHYMGGCLLASEMLGWASTMLAYNARPPDPDVVGARWREMWLDRMEQTPPFVEAWLSHQRRDAFWQHGSVCQNYADIQCPVYLIGGWNDGYSNAIPRLLAGLSVPRKGLIGPWSHQYPESANNPGPAMGFHQECLRWWDQWLKGIDTGIMDEPMLRSWMLESVHADVSRSEWPGRWVADDNWPPPAVTETVLYCGEGVLTAETPAEPSMALQQGSVQTCGLDAGAWCAMGAPGDLPGDQRFDDALSLCFDSAPLAQRTEILGFPRTTLTLAVDRPNALLAVRLCDVAPDGASTLITRGLLNLTHRHGHETPQPLEPGREYTVALDLNAVAHALPAGHRWRLAVSPCYWPHAWPSPQPVTLALIPGAHSFLTLPTRPPQAADDTLAPFEPPEISPPLPVETLRAAATKRSVERDPLTGITTLYVRHDEGRLRFLDTALENTMLESDVLSESWYTIHEDDPLSARVRCRWCIEFQRGDWQVRVETDSTMTGDSDSFRVVNVVEGYEGRSRVFAKTGSFGVPRDGV